MLVSGLTAACAREHNDFSGPPRSEAERQTDATLYSSSPAQSGMTVCTFDRTRVLIAYYKSEKFSASMRELVAEYNKAKAAGDSAAQAACRRDGEARQALAHRQLVGQAPLANIVSDYREAIDAIAHNSNASLIIARDACTVGPPVDVTELLVHAMPPAQKTEPEDASVPLRAPS